jgi:ferredoxin
MENNLAFIDADKCKLCRKCVLECPTSSILEIGFPPRKEKVEAGKTNNAEQNSVVAKPDKNLNNKEE